MIVNSDFSKPLQRSLAIYNMLPISKKLELLYSIMHDRFDMEYTDITSKIYNKQKDFDFGFWLDLKYENLVLVSESDVRHEHFCHYNKWYSVFREEFDYRSNYYDIEISDDESYDLLYFKIGDLKLSHCIDSMYVVDVKNNNAIRFHNFWILLYEMGLISDMSFLFFPSSYHALNNFGFNVHDSSYFKMTSFSKIRHTCSFYNETFSNIKSNRLHPIFKEIIEDKDILSDIQIDARLYMEG